MKKQKGITLVVLVITIIILLILAGITINLLVENRLFKNAKLAKEKYQNSEIEENNYLIDYDNKINEYIGSTRENNPYSISLEEKAIGTWITGETIYSKTIYIEALPSSSSCVSYAHEIENVKMIWVDTSKSFAIWYGGSYANFPIMSRADGRIIVGFPDVSPTELIIKADSNRSDTSAYVTLNYIKNN